MEDVSCRSKFLLPSKYDHPASKQSGIKGVRWHKQKGAWAAKVYVTKNGIKKEISGGTFKPKDGTPEVDEDAKQQAIQARAELQKKYCFPFSSSTRKR